MSRRRRSRNRSKPVASLIIAFIVALLVIHFGGEHSLQDVQNRIRQDFAYLKSLLLQQQNTLPSAPSGAIVPDGAIQVFFAPNTSYLAGGIDDHLIAFINSAQHEVICAFYELELQSVADALIARHRGGVKVSIVSDSDYQERPAMLACLNAGIPVVFDRRKPFMHDKFCVVDGEAVWTGSTNATENCMYRNNNNSVLIRSRELAADYAAEFSEMFDQRLFGPRSPANTPYPEVQVGEDTIECYFAPEDHVREKIIARLEEAQREIDFEAFSFTSKEIAETMVARRAEGVRVRGLFEARNAKEKHSQDEYLRDHGAEVHMDSNPYNMHNKVMIIDDAIVITGSYNFSRNAEEDNDENLLIIHDTAVAATYEAEFERLIR